MLARIINSDQSYIKATEIHEKEVFIVINAKQTAKIQEAFCDPLEIENGKISLGSNSFEISFTLSHLKDSNLIKEKYFTEIQEALNKHSCLKSSFEEIKITNLGDTLFSFSEWEKMQHNSIEENPGIKNYSEGYKEFGFFENQFSQGDTFEILEQVPEKDKEEKIIDEQNKFL